MAPYSPGNFTSLDRNTSRSKVKFAKWRTITTQLFATFLVIFKIIDGSYSSDEQPHDDQLSTEKLNCSGMNIDHKGIQRGN